MTYKEVLDYWVTKKPIRSGKTLWLMIAKAIEKADKYAWHDLRKDPNDLPKLNQGEEFKDCLCKFKNPFGVIYHEVVSYMYFDEIEDYDWMGLSWRSREDLIAWKEIDPLEEVTK